MQYELLHHNTEKNKKSENVVRLDDVGPQKTNTVPIYSLEVCIHIIPLNHPYYLTSPPSYIATILVV